MLSQYKNDVIRADHHGQNVNQIVLTLAGAVIWKVTQDVEVRTYNNKTANILWLTLGLNRYAVAFNHQTGNIELRELTQNDNVLASFNNSTTANQVKTIFAVL